jgi:RNA polymerase sigma-70 factor (ECF subfamily)
LEAVRSIGSFQGRSDVKTWLFSIGRHRWFAYLRKKRSEPSFVFDLLLESEKTPEDTILLRQAIQRVYAYLESEPERTQRLLELRMEGFSYHEIAQALNISENSARVIHFRIREKLRKILEEEGFAFPPLLFLPFIVISPRLRRGERWHSLW